MYPESPYPVVRYVSGLFDSRKFNEFAQSPLVNGLCPGGAVLLYLQVIEIIFRASLSGSYKGHFIADVAK
jgi:hypothetical protein